MRISDWSSDVFSSDLILNNKDDYEVTLVPSEINVTYYVPLSRYTEVDPEDFRITADLDEWQEKNKNVLTVRLERFPDFIRIVRSKPEISSEERSVGKDGVSTGRSRWEKKK